MKNSLLIKTIGILAATTILFGAAVISYTPSHAASVAPPKKDLELRVAIDDFGNENFDPVMGEMAAILWHMYDSPFDLGPGGKVAPGIVKQWKLAPDGLSWTLNLRNDVFFHEGVNADGTVVPRSKMTAKDVAFSFEMSVAEKALRGAWWRDILGKKPKTEVIDDYTVRIYTNGPQPMLPALCIGGTTPSIFIVPKAYCEKNGPEHFRRHPIGTGPYKFVRLVPGDLMEFKAVDYSHWRSGVPAFNRLTVHLIPEETTRVAMLEKGMLDAIAATTETAVKLKNKGFNIETGSRSLVDFYCIGAYHPAAKGMPLADVRVRQALSLAINRQEIMKTLFYGLAELPGPATMGWYNADLTPALLKKWQDWAKNNYRYDPLKAKQLLKEAGYGDGFSFDFWLAPDSEAPYCGDILMAAASYWKQIGVTCNIVPVDRAIWRTNRLVKKSTKLIGKMGLAAMPAQRPSTVKQHYYWTSKDGSMDLFAGAPDLEAKVDALWNEGLTTFDPVRYEQIVDAVLEINTSSYTGFGIVLVPLTWALGPRLDGHIGPTISHMEQCFGAWKYSGKEPRN